MPYLSALVYFLSILSFWQQHYLSEGNMFNLPGNLEPKVSFEGRSKNAASLICVRKQGKTGERDNKSLPCSNSYSARWSLYTFIGEVMNNDALPFEIIYSVLQVSQEPFTNMTIPSQISGRYVTRNTLEQIGRQHYGLIF